MAWAAIMRPKESRCGDVNDPARSEWRMVMGNSRNPLRAMSTGRSCTTVGTWGSFPMLDFVATSRPVAALTYSSAS